jgi:antitoxin component of MazEF toxin-antitoxin module
MKIHALIQGTGKTAAGMEIPAEVVAALGSSKRPAVRVTINGYTYRSSIASMGGKFMLGVSNEVRQQAGVAAGQEVDVELELDTAPRAVVVPDDFKKALAKDKAASQTFAALNYSNQRRLVMAIEAIKTAETRQRRIEKTVSQLHDGQA